MAAADPNNNLALMDVMNARSGLGDLLRQQNQMEAAVASYRKSVDAAERLNSGGALVFANIDAGIQAHHRLGMALVLIGMSRRPWNTSKRPQTICQLPRSSTRA